MASDTGLAVGQTWRSLGFHHLTINGILDRRMVQFVLVDADESEWSDELPEWVLADFLEGWTLTSSRATTPPTCPRCHSVADLDGGKWFCPTSSCGQTFVPSWR